MKNKLKLILILLLTTQKNSLFSFETQLELEKQLENWENANHQETLSNIKFSQSVALGHHLDQTFENIKSCRKSENFKEYFNQIQIKILQLKHIHEQIPLIKKNPIQIKHLQKKLNLITFTNEA
jgi:hypothetical protein